MYSKNYSVIKRLLSSYHIYISYVIFLVVHEIKLLLAYFLVGAVRANCLLEKLCELGTRLKVNWFFLYAFDYATLVPVCTVFDFVCTSKGCKLSCGCCFGIVSTRLYRFPFRLYPFRCGNTVLERKFGTNTPEGVQTGTNDSEAASVCRIRISEKMTKLVGTPILKIRYFHPRRGTNEKKSGTNGY